LHIDEEMMQEVAQIRDLSNPKETLLVVDSLMGQDAVNVANEFKEKVGVSGVVLTRVDGDARGGAALSMRAITGMPIQFLGVGEKADAFETFDAKRVADRILGMGDVVGLVETALAKANQEDLQAQAMQMFTGRFDMNDLLKQIEQMESMGDMKSLISMLPARFANGLNKSHMDNKLLKRQAAMIKAMTPKERANPDIIKANRKIRIAAGAGVKVEDVNRLIRGWERMADAMKKLKKLGPFGMMSKIKELNSMLKKMPGNGGGFPPFDV
jgi:signal recognition particle subunit SRP54